MPQPPSRGFSAARHRVVLAATGAIACAVVYMTLQASAASQQPERESEEEQPDSPDKQRQEGVTPADAVAALTVPNHKEGSQLVVAPLHLVGTRQIRKQTLALLRGRWPLLGAAAVHGKEGRALPASLVLLRGEKVLGHVALVPPLLEDYEQFEDTKEASDGESSPMLAGPVPEVKVENLLVDEKLRRMGLGLALLNAAVLYAQRELAPFGVRRLVGEVASGLLPFCNRAGAKKDFEMFVKMREFSIADDTHRVCADLSEVSGKAGAFFRARKDSMRVFGF